MQRHPEIHKLEDPHVVDEYLDDELDAAARSAFEAHLESCAECRDELALARRVVEGLRAWPEQTCPPAVTRAVLEVARPSWSERWRGLWQDLTAPRHAWQPALALLVVAALGLGVWRLTEPSPPIAAPAATTSTADAYSPAEIARAKAEVELAFAYLGKIGQTASDTVGEKVLENRVVTPFTRTLGLLPPAGGEEEREANASSS